MITGTCILPTLNLSRNEIKFSITEEDKKFDKKESLNLDNTYDYDIDYEWKAPANSVF
jgi:Leucine-rich repeat (LRR) protein